MREGVTPIIRINSASEREELFEEAAAIFKKN